MFSNVSGQFTSCSLFSDQLGTWCGVCACTRFTSLPSSSECANCGHYSNEHTLEETREVMFVIQELAAGGELFGLIMHCGPFTEELARYYFHQLINGLFFFLWCFFFLCRFFCFVFVCCSSQWSLPLISFRYSIIFISCRPSSRSRHCSS